MLIQVLILHGQLAFAIALKQGLERSNRFEAHPFRSVDAAFDYLRDHTQDVAVVDFTLTEMNGAEIVRRLREIQPTLNVIVTPHQPDTVINTLDLQGTLDAKFTARELAPRLRDLFNERARPSDGEAKPVLLNRPEILPEMTSLDSILSNMGDIFHEDASDTPIPEDDEESSPAWDEERREPDLFDEVLNALPREVEDRRKHDPFEDLVNSMRAGQPHQPLPARRSEYVEFVFNGGLDALFDQIDRAAGKSNEPPTLDESSRTFQKLAAEEPPPPTFEESGTVGDLISSVNDQSFREVLSILRDEPPPPIKPEALHRSQAHLVPVPRDEFNFDAVLDEDDAESESSPARDILAQVLNADQSEGFSLEELLANIERQLPRHRPRVQPLPSWVKESQARSDSSKFLTTEPDFLPESLPEIPPRRAEDESGLEGLLEPSEEYDSRFVDQLTLPSKAQPIETVPEETSWLEPLMEEPARPSDYVFDYGDQSETPTPPPPPDTLPEFPVLATENFNTSFELLAAFEVVDDKPLDSGRYDFTLGRAPVTPSPAADDPRIAQLALSLTEASLEMTAEASLLTRAGEIVAYTGQLAEDEVLELRPFIPVDASSIPSGSNIRFVSAKDSPKNYMLYSAVTEDDLILSLVFAATTPLRDIRRQGQRLAQALQAVPDAAAAPLPPPPVPLEPVDAGTRLPYAYVWLLDERSPILDGSAAQAIYTGLQTQLRERGWRVTELRVEEDYIYLLADVPGETMPFEIVRDLKRRSAEIAHAQNPAFDPDLLWSDGYLVVAPGRPLDVDEIQGFISFERMG